MLQVKDHESARQGRVAAKVNLNLRGKPADLETIAGPDKKRGFSQVVLHCDLLH
jgi:hypothetical protein